MGKRFAFVIGVAALGAAVIATGASANFRSVDDPRGHVKCLHDWHLHGPCSDSAKRSVDIVRATAGHAGQERRRLKHTIRVVGKLQQPDLWINTDSDPRCEWILPINRFQRRPRFQGCRSTARGGRARIDFHLHSVEIFFSKRSIGNPRRYGWSARTWAGSPEAHAMDHAPNRGRYIQHRFGAAATGVMALGAQTTAAAPQVVKYDTKLTLTKDWGGNYHGRVRSEVGKCVRGRRVVLFKRRPGADRRLGSVRSTPSHWWLRIDRDYGNHVWAKVKPKARDRFVCRADRALFRY